METAQTKVLRTSMAMRSLPLEEEVFITIDIILYMAQFMRFEDYRNFISAFSPTFDYCDVVRDKLWQLSTHTIAIPFLNEKRLKIVYNFDASRTKENRILFNIETLLPIFGRVSPAGSEEYLNAASLYNFISMHVHLNMCSGCQYTACLCHQLRSRDNNGRQMVKPRDVACKYGHFHHYCSQHVRNWFDFVLMRDVMLHEMPSLLLDQEMSERLLQFMSNTIHLKRR